MTLSKEEKNSSKFKTKDLRESSILLILKNCNSITIRESDNKPVGKILKE
jgi:hypothetical protein